MKKLLLSCLLIIGCNTTPEIITEKFYDTNSTELGYQIRSIKTDNSIIVKHFLNGLNLTDGIDIQDGIWCITINSNNYFFSTENKNSVTEKLMTLDYNTNENYQFTITSSWLGWHPDENTSSRKLMQLDGSLEHSNIFNKQENRFTTQHIAEITLKMKNLLARNENTTLSGISMSSYAAQSTYFSVANLWFEQGGAHTPCYIISLLKDNNSGIITKEILLRRIDQNNVKIGNEMISNGQLKGVISSIRQL